MKSITFTEFRSQASGLLRQVEKGETLLILRHGRPIAEVSPVSSQKTREPSWKSPALRLSTKGKGLCSMILDEWENEDLS